MTADIEEKEEIVKFVEKDEDLLGSSSEQEAEPEKGEVGEEGDAAEAKVEEEATAEVNIEEVDAPTLCDNCSQDTGKIYLDKLIEVREMQDRFNQLWTKCQRCSGSLHNEVLCSNKNCDIFYMRIKTKNSLQEKLETISQW